MRILLFFLVLAIIGAGLFAYSCTLPYYHDQARFDAAYSALVDRYYGPDPDKSPSHANRQQLTEDWYTLHTREMTAHQWLWDTSLTLIITGIGGMVLFFRGAKGLKTPPNKWWLLLVGLIASMATLFGLAASAQFDNSPPWADANIRSTAYLCSQGIFVLPVFVAAHGIFLIGSKFNLQTQVFGFRIRYANWTLVAALGFWAILTALIIAGAGWFFLIATPLWFYFYASLLAIRAKGHELSISNRTA